MSGTPSRRSILQYAAAAIAVSACRDKTIATSPDPSATTQSAALPAAGAIPRRPLGKTGESVSILALGGSHLGEAKDLDEAKRIVAEALDGGVNFFDNAWEYHDGRSEDWLGKALAGKRDRAFLMTKVCTHGRDADVAMQQLEESLKRLGTDHLDLWQVHECVYDNDPLRHYAKGGVLEALTKAKAQGKVRFVGFTGHKDPEIHLGMLARGYPFDTIQMPLNAFDGTFRSFAQRVVPEAQKRGIAVLGMKSLGGLGEPVTRGVVTVEEALRYALSLPVAAVITGVDSLAVLRQNLAIARNFKPMSEGEMQELRTRVAPYAADGRYELYKTTTRFDAKVGREQHGFPTQDEVPL